MFRPGTCGLGNPPSEKLCTVSGFLSLSQSQMNDRYKAPYSSKDYSPACAGKRDKNRTRECSPKDYKLSLVGFLPKFSGSTRRSADGREGAGHPFARRMELFRGQDSYRFIKQFQFLFRIFHFLSYFPFFYLNFLIFNAWDITPRWKVCPAKKDFF